MPQVFELIGIRGNAGEGNYVRQPYFAQGYADAVAAIAAVAAVVPDPLGTLALRSIEVDEQVEEGWMVDATWGVYQKKEPPATGESQFNFEIGLQPAKILVPVAAHVVYTLSGVTAPADESRWLIGDQGDGERPDGVEVFEPTVSFSETHYITEATLTAGYRNTLMRLVGKTNNATFKTWDAGEVLSQAITGSKRGSSDWEVTFRYAARENQTGLTIAGITGIDKEGWQYLWPRHRLQKDGTAPVISSVVEHIVVSTVFRSADFADFGIGT